MNTLTQIALLAGLIAAISLIWLAGRAFSKHVAWGLLVLFLSPLAAVLFGIRFWRDEKRPFLVYVATFTIAMTLGLYVFTVQGGWEVVRTALRSQQSLDLQISGENGRMSFVPTSLNPVAETPVRNGKTAVSRPEQTRPILPEAAESSTNTGEQVAPERSTPTVTTAKPAASTMRYRATYMSIPPSRAEDYIGMTVKVKPTNRPEQDCVLRSVTPAGLGFEQHVHGGVFSFKYRHGDIEKLRVLVKQAY